MSKSKNNFEDFDPKEFLEDVKKVVEPLKEAINKQRKEIDNNKKVISDIKNGEESDSSSEKVLSVGNSKFTVDGVSVSVNASQKDKDMFWQGLGEIMAKHNIRRVKADLYKY